MALLVLRIPPGLSGPAAGYEKQRAGPAPRTGAGLVSGRLLRPVDGARPGGSGGSENNARLFQLGARRGNSTTGGLSDIMVRSPSLATGRSPLGETGARRAARTIHWCCVTAAVRWALRNSGRWCAHPAEFPASWRRTLLAPRRLSAEPRRRQGQAAWSEGSTSRSRNMQRGGSAKEGPAGTAAPGAGGHKTREPDSHQVPLRAAAGIPRGAKRMVRKGGFEPPWV